MKTFVAILFAAILLGPAMAAMNLDPKRLGGPAIIGCDLQNCRRPAVAPKKPVQPISPGHPPKNPSYQK